MVRRGYMLVQMQPTDMFMYGSTQHFLDQNSFVQVGALDLVEVELVKRDEDCAVGHEQTGSVCETDADGDADADMIKTL